jgi:cell division septation protein DedD
MSLSRASKVRSLIFVAALTGLVWLAPQWQPVKSLMFLSPPVPPNVAKPSCDDSQIACPDGGAKSFGPLTISYPNGFYMEPARIYCDFRDAPSVPACPPGLSPVGQPVSCYFGDMHEEPIQMFLQPIQVTMAIPESQASHVALYTYQASGWARLTSAVPVSAGAVTFSLERLNPVGSDNLNYFWLFESQPAAPTPTTAPTDTPTVATEPKPAASSTPRPTSTPTESSTPTPVPTNTSIPTSTPAPTQGTSGGRSPLCAGGSMPAVGAALGVVIALRKKSLAK